MQKRQLTKLLNKMKKSILILTMSAIVFGGMMMFASCDKANSIGESIGDNMTQVMVGYNSCGGGCISTNIRCCGTCSASGWRSTCGPADYGCVRITQNTQPITYRFECWHIGPDKAAWNGNYNFGLDLNNPILQNAKFYRVKREIGTDSIYEFDTQFSYNEESTIAFFDPDIILESLLPELKYKINFFDSSDQLLHSIDYNHQ